MYEREYRVSRWSHLDFLRIGRVFEVSDLGFFCIFLYFYTILKLHHRRCVRRGRLIKIQLRIMFEFLCGLAAKYSRRPLGRSTANAGL